MTEYGHSLSSEEHAPNDLVRDARRAEEVGFTFALVSDHYHPWTDAQGEAPFVWSVIGAIAHATERLRLGTGVTCPTVRLHPAIVAQAAATAEAMMPGRFFLGVGTGEALNEHILGDRWPETDVRLEMLEEAVEVIRLLWQGGMQSHHGRHYTVENARIYTLPDPPPDIYVAASGTKSAELAGRIGDGLVSTAPKPDVVQTWKKAGGTGPAYAHLTVCWAGDADTAKKTLYDRWPNAGVKGELSQELPLPAHFEQAAQMVTPDDLAQSLPHGPDPEAYLQSIAEYVDAGFTHLYFHQVGDDQEGWFRFWEKELAPNVPA
ncbi:MAG TPA: TIGR03557 family F420-dependent LLM class oxidoreductase [Acidimicrobiales bacterium]|jgi:G6PDH family F420-dependent oxidoreductase|nr:TIGR03557 family F420-dependent LLM class oxidoreductase [Acidimicrobiales bacterium]